MSAVDDDHQPLSSYSSTRNSFLSTSLNHVHISEAIERSRDNGATLMFSKMNLLDIGAVVAEELATIGRETQEDQSPVMRYMPIL